MKIAVIGGGASGLFVSGLLLQNHEVFLFEKNEKFGKKLYITGKGRCNLTNLCSPDEFLQNVITNKQFLFSAINNFTSFDTVDYFENLGLKTKVERGNRVFPLSDKSNDVIKCLVNQCERQKVNMVLNCNVFNIFKNGNKFNIKTEKDTLEFDTVVISTGGISYSATGSTGDGYQFAKRFGHTIIKPKPSLVPILLKDDFVKDCEGLSLKNVCLTINTQKLSKSFFGEMLFTSEGISGPIALTASSYIQDNAKLSLNFKPALSKEQIKNRIEREIDLNKDKLLQTMLTSLLPKKLCDIFIKVCKLENKKCKSLNTKEIETIIQNLTCFPLDFERLKPIDYAIITSGGIDVKEINPRTMESKICPNLYFTGEVIDIDALTGGFNLQIAWSTSHAVYRALLKEK